jgi:hypothetical protein
MWLSVLPWLLASVTTVRGSTQSCRKDTVELAQQSRAQQHVDIVHITEPFECSFALERHRVRWFTERLIGLIASQMGS